MILISLISIIPIFSSPGVFDPPRSCKIPALLLGDCVLPLASIILVPSLPDPLIPGTISIDPALPVADVPDPIRTDPVFDDALLPDLSVTIPLSPPDSDDLDAIEIVPVLLADDDPLSSDTLPPSVLADPQL